LITVSNSITHVRTLLVLQHNSQITISSAPNNVQPLLVLQYNCVSPISSYLPTQLVCLSQFSTVTSPLHCCGETCFIVAWKRLFHCCVEAFVSIVALPHHPIVAQQEAEVMLPRKPNVTVSCVSCTCDVQGECSSQAALWPPLLYNIE
jgi:hypothetical protein